MTHANTRHRHRSSSSDVGGRLAETLSAALVIAIGMGFGRFAFTGMYPLMVSEGLMSLKGGSLVASSNYVGYLVGAILVSWLAPPRAAAAARGAMLGSVLCLALLALPGGLWWIGAIRFIAGVFSAISLITASVWLLQVIEHPRGAPLLFSGVGFGIFVSAELIASGVALHADSAVLWSALAFSAALLSLIAWPALGKLPCQRGSASPVSKCMNRS